jgi:hypothetical protein
LQIWTTTPSGLTNFIKQPATNGAMPAYAAQPHD